MCAEATSSISSSSSRAGSSTSASAARRTSIATGESPRNFRQRASPSATRPRSVVVAASSHRLAEVLVRGRRARLRLGAGEVGEDSGPRSGGGSASARVQVPRSAAPGRRATAPARRPRAAPRPSHRRRAGAVSASREATSSGAAPCALSSPQRARDLRCGRGRAGRRRSPSSTIGCTKSSRVAVAGEHVGAAQRLERLFGGQQVEFGELGGERGRGPLAEQRDRPRHRGAVAGSRFRRCRTTVEIASGRARGTWPLGVGRPAAACRAPRTASRHQEGLLPVARGRRRRARAGGRTRPRRAPTGRRRRVSVGGRSVRAAGSATSPRRTLALLLGARAGPDERPRPAGPRSGGRGSRESSRLGSSDHWASSTQTSSGASAARFAHSQYRPCSARRGLVVAGTRVLEHRTRPGRPRRPASGHARRRRRTNSAGSKNCRTTPKVNERSSWTRAPAACACPPRSRRRGRRPAAASRRSRPGPRRRRPALAHGARASAASSAASSSSARAGPGCRTRRVCISYGRAPPSSELCLDRQAEPSPSTLTVRYSTPPDSNARHSRSVLAATRPVCSTSSTVTSLSE